MRGGQRRCIVGIAGGSGSGKTTLARRLVEGAGKAGVDGQVFSLDNYYRPLAEISLAERKAYNFDHPEALDLPLALDHLRRLKAGEAVEQPVYDYRRYTRSARPRACRPTPLVVVEGLYALHAPELLGLYDYRVFISTGLATAVLRRMARDIAERGRDVEGAKHQILATVLPMYETHVKPTQRNAHFSINWDGEEIPEKAAEGLVRMARDFFR